MNHEGSVISVRERGLLLRRAQAGDAEALNVLFESCRRTLYFTALRILARPQDAEDAVQDAMLSAFTHLRGFQGRADFLTWATRIVVNAALQQMRKARTKATVPLDQIDEEFDGAPFSECLRDPRPSPEVQVQELERAKMLDQALHKLPVESRRAIQLCNFSDYSLDEAAKRLGLPVGTLKARLHRGRRALLVGLKRETQARRGLANKQSLRLCTLAQDGLRAA